ncbi:hypothetical protein PSI19_19050, partial [Xenorhabdus khoisanae]|nr:hypothetical protein [Xenorhabdus khoisanae]
ENQTKSQYKKRPDPCLNININVTIPSDSPCPMVQAVKSSLTAAAPSFTTSRPKSKSSRLSALNPTVHLPPVKLIKPNQKFGHVMNSMMVNPLNGEPSCSPGNRDNSY